MSRPKGCRNCVMCKGSSCYLMTLDKAGMHRCKDCANFFMMPCGSTMCDAMRCDFMPGYKGDDLKNCEYFKGKKVTI